LLRLVILAALTISIPLLPAWIILTQPILSFQTRSTLKADPAALERHVRTLSEDFHPRDYMHPENLDRAAAYIRAQFAKTKAQVREQEYEVNGRRYRNIIARFGGDENLIVVGAHYDGCNDTPGADDNASGVAGLLELATLLDRHPTGQNVELVAYTLEEPPFFRTQEMGSARHARELTERKVSPKAVVILEMIGYFSDAPWSQDYPVPLLRAFYPSRGNFIAVAGRTDQWKFMRNVKRGMIGATALPVYTISAPAALPGLDFSDHLNYWAHDWNAVMVTDTAFYRNHAYHGPDDITSRLDYSRMSDVVVAVYEGIRGLQ
jgi:Zn-dependent M28 family amino/carboxypeptidase